MIRVRPERNKTCSISMMKERPVVLVKQVIGRWKRAYIPKGKK